jgi:excisionase family DNA binding protein
MTTSTDRLLNAGEVGEILGLDKRSVQRLAANGTLPVVKVGRLMRFRRESILRWIEQQETGG